jgi:hypothetical protein
VEISLFNPLFIPLTVSYVRLTANFEPKQPITHQDDTTKNEDAIDGPLLSSITKFFKADPVSLVMGPRERKLVRLSITALEEGELNIEGIHWQIEGLVEGTKKLQLRGRRLNDTKQQRLSVAYEEDNRLSLKIIPAMPLLQVEMRDMLPVIYSGQLHKSVMVIKNIGSMGMKGLICKMSHPMLFSLGTESINQPEVDFPLIKNSEVGSGVHVANFSQIPKKLQDDLSIVHIPFQNEHEKVEPTNEEENNAEQSVPVPGGILRPNESIEIPVYIRGSGIGVNDVQFLFYYEPEEHNHDIRFRLYRHNFGLRVIDSIRVRTFTQPSLQNVDEFILGVQIKNNVPHTTSPNQDDFAAIQLRQLTAVSPMWTFSPLNFSQIEDEKLRIPAQESTTLYLRVHKLQTTQENQAGYHSHLFLAPNQSSSIDHHDTTQSPHIDFLFRDCTTVHESLLNITVLVTQTGKTVAPPPTTTDSFLDEPISFSDQRHSKKVEKKKQQVTQAKSVLSKLNEVVNDDEDEPPNFSFLNTHGMSLMIFWSASSGSSSTNYSSIIGQSHALRLNFVPSRDAGIEAHVASKTPWHTQPDCPLTVTLEYQERLDHDFERSVQCNMSILFRIKNISPDLPCDFTLELLSPTAVQALQPALANAMSTSVYQQTTPQPQQPTNSFIWMGTTRVQYKGLLPGQMLHVPVKVCFFAPGQYNLNQFKLTWVVRDERQPDEMATLLAMSFSDMQYMLSVHDKREE